MTASNTIDLKFQMTRNDLVSALREQAFRSWLLWLIFGIFILRLTMELYYIVTLGGVPDGNVFSPWIAIALALFAIFPLLVVRFRTDPRMFEEQTWSFASDGVTFASGQHSANFVWKKLNKITLNGSFYQLHFSKQDIALIPRRVFPNAQIETQFKNLAKQKVSTNIK
ncbi:MAG: hypothetical protein HZB51_23495 [Chloroflexi bacterium]|nr:hypothetical protein [Chloroflexota bacterium]